MAEFVQSGTADGATVLHVVGEVDLAVIEDLKTAVRSCLAGSTAVAVDLSELEFIDSSGLGALVQLLKEATRDGAALTLTGVRPSTHRLLEVTGLTSVFDFRLTDTGPGDVAGT